MVKLFVEMYTPHRNIGEDKEKRTHETREIEAMLRVGVFSVRRSKVR